jgi:hypothetical protein
MNRTEASSLFCVLQVSATARLVAARTNAVAAHWRINDTTGMMMDKPDKITPEMKTTDVAKHADA